MDAPRMIMEAPSRARAARRAACAITALAVSACADVTVPLGQRGPIELGPSAGQYVVGEFVFNNTCVDPPAVLIGSRASARTAVFDLQPGTDREGVVELTGSFEVPDPTPGEPAIVIFEGPDWGVYTITGDTLRLRFANRL
ncbi:MAG: hypothetical protein OER21_14010, partial [Gemmatimonadota bacterium]|nr:hypothetical protein [Gemmatimonadota bacterium]